MVGRWCVASNTTGAAGDVAPLSAMFADGAHVERTYPRRRELRVWPSLRCLTDDEPARNQPGTAARIAAPIPCRDNRIVGASGNE